MSTISRSTRAAVGVLSLALALSACSGSAAPTGSSTAASEAPASAPADAGAQHNEADVRFAQMMIPHHQQALEMAEVALQRTQNTEVRALAEQIQSAQDPEITILSGFLESWGAAPADEGMAGMDHSGMSGMMGQGEMDGLAGASGAAFDTMFLEMMIAHHEGAIAEAQRETAEGANAQAKDLAAQIVSGQTAELDQMRQLQQQ
jgi:uncharacterized protein (DUF305 family)